MPFDRPTLQELVDRIAADIKARITGATTLAIRSVLFVIGRVMAGTLHLLYGYLDNITVQLFATTASGQFLETIGAELGVVRKAATVATGSTTITGTTGTIVPVGSEVQSPDGNKYTTDAAVTMVAGTAIAAITASVAGVDSNENAGVILTFTSPIISIDTDTTVTTAGLTGGADEETDSELSQRILSRKAQAPMGGAQADYETWALEVSGVTRVWVQPEHQGAGTVAVYFVRDGDTPIFPDAAEIATVRAYLIEHEDTLGNTVGIPVTAEPGLTVAAPTPKTIDLEINIFPNTSAVQVAVEAELTDLLFREGGPDGTLYLSRISEAISAANDEERHVLVTPVADVSIAANELAQLGTVTFNDY